MHKILPLGLEGCYEIYLSNVEDSRGDFYKIFTGEKQYEEQFLSRSKGNAIRGMHLQKDTSRLITSLSGRVFDVLLDLRKGSDTYKKSISNILFPFRQLYVPAGIAHGFYSIEEATLLYTCTRSYVKEDDIGVRWNSIGIEWPNPKEYGYIESPIVSVRDLNLPTLEYFVWSERLK